MLGFSKPDRLCFLSCTLVKLVAIPVLPSYEVTSHLTYDIGLLW